MSRWLESLPAKVRAEINGQINDYANYVAEGLENHFKNELKASKHGREPKRNNRMSLTKNALFVQVIPASGVNAYKDFCKAVQANNAYLWITKGERIRHVSGKYKGHIDVRQGYRGLLLASITSDHPDMSVGHFVGRLAAWLNGKILAINIQPGA
jgi:hypothetical protein